jgi:hypothetical protein
LLGTGKGGLRALVTKISSVKHFHPKFKLENCVDTSDSVQLQLSHPHDGLSGHCYSTLLQNDSAPSRSDLEDLQTETINS